MSGNRFRLKEKQRRRYTLTRTKAFVGFLLSALISIIFTPYFERYGSLLIAQVRAVITGEPTPLRDEDSHMRGQNE